MKRRAIIYRMIPIYIIVIVVLIVVAQKGSQTVTTYIENQPIKNRICIIIDPGHGGIDGGATSCSGVLESQLNLQISLCLRDLFHLLGRKTLMIRTEDISIHTEGSTIAQMKVSDLKQRVKIVNETENSLLVSIHQNHFSDSKYYGPQVFYGKGQGSGNLAQEMQAALNKYLCPNSKRKTKSAGGVYLMEKINRTGILVECGFLSNPGEDKKLNTPAYQKQLSCVIAATCCNYLKYNDIA